MATLSGESLTAFQKSSPKLLRSMKSMVLISAFHLIGSRTHMTVPVSSCLLHSSLQGAVRGAEQLGPILRYDQVVLHLQGTDPRQADGGLNAQGHAGSERFLLILQVRPLQRRGQSYSVADAVRQGVPR